MGGVGEKAARGAPEHPDLSGSQPGFGAFLVSSFVFSPWLSGFWFCDSFH